MPSNHLILCCPLLLLPLIFPRIRVFSNDESALHIRWSKYWSFSISLSNEYLGLISFRMDWFVLLAVQGTLKSLLQHHCSEASILQCSAFFVVQFSHPYMTTGKNYVCSVTQSCPTLCDPMDCSPPSSFVHGHFSRQEHWNGLPCPPPGDLPNPGIEPMSPTLQVDSLPAEPPGKPIFTCSTYTLMLLPQFISP